MAFKQSAVRPHKLSAKRIAQIEKWRMLGAQARRGKNTAKKTNYHRKRAKRGTSVTATYGRATAWGVQKMVLPVGVGGPIVSMAKNRLPGYNQLQIVKSSGHTATKGAKKRAKAKRR